MRVQNVSSARAVDPYRNPHLTLRMSRSGPVTVVTVEGEVDGDNAHLIPELVESLTGDATQRLILDLARVTFVSAAGVAAFLHVRNTLAATGGQLVLRDPSPVVLTALAGTHVNRAFHVHTTPRGGDGSSLVPSPPPAAG
jgi:anti-anti-sigma factor